MGLVNRKVVLYAKNARGFGGDENSALLDLCPNALPRLNYPSSMLFVSAKVSHLGLLPQVL